MTLTRRQENELERLLLYLKNPAKSGLGDIKGDIIGRVATAAYRGLVAMRAKPNNSRRLEDGGIERQLAGKLYLSIKRLHNIQAPNLDSWARVIDLMIRKDGLGANEIKHVVEYIPQDKFWRGTILSASGLRKHFKKIDYKRNEYEIQRAISDNARKFLNEKKRRPIY